jgi:hypothetical protein
MNNGDICYFEISAGVTGEAAAETDQFLTLEVDTISQTYVEVAISGGLTDDFVDVCIL